MQMYNFYNLDIMKFLVIYLFISTVIYKLHLNKCNKCMNDNNYYLLAGAYFSKHVRQILFHELILFTGLLVVLKATLIK